MFMQAVESVVAGYIGVFVSLVENKTGVSKEELMELWEEAQKARPEFSHVEKKKGKRTTSAYNLFCKEKRPILKAQGMSFGDISSTLGKMWRDLSDEEKKAFSPAKKPVATVDPETVSNSSEAEAEDESSPPAHQEKKATKQQPKKKTPATTSDDAEESSSDHEKKQVKKPKTGKKKASPPPPPPELEDDEEGIELWNQIQDYDKEELKRQCEKYNVARGKRDTKNMVLTLIQQMKFSHPPELDDDEDDQNTWYLIQSWEDDEFEHQCVRYGVSDGKHKNKKTILALIEAMKE